MLQHKAGPSSGIVVDQLGKGNSAFNRHDRLLLVSLPPHKEEELETLRKVENRKKEVRGEDERQPEERGEKC